MFSSCVRVSDYKHFGHLESDDSVNYQREAKTREDTGDGGTES